MSVRQNKRIIYLRLWQRRSEVRNITRSYQDIFVGSTSCQKHHYIEWIVMILKKCLWQSQRLCQQDGKMFWKAITKKTKQTNKKLWSQILECLDVNSSTLAVVKGRNAWGWNAELEEGSDLACAHGVSEDLCWNRVFVSSGEKFKGDVIFCKTFI